MTLILRGADTGAGASPEEARMTVRFSALGDFYEINSWLEGNFMERVQPGSMRFARASDVKAMFNHGRDPSVGEKLLGIPETIDERDGFAVAEVPLFDASYVRDLLPGLRAGAYGASFMFKVEEESWDWEPVRGAHNPDGLPERTITGVRLFEQGPVTWPANPAAYTQANNASPVRCGTDWYHSSIRSEPGELAELRSKLHKAPPGSGRAAQGRHARGLRERRLREFKMEGLS